MRVFSEFWKLSVRDNDPKQKYTNGVGKAHSTVSFLSGEENVIERAQQAGKFLRK